jgi:hypothetical protein
VLIVISMTAEPLVEIQRWQSLTCSLRNQRCCRTLFKALKLVLQKIRLPSTVLCGLWRAAMFEIRSQYSRVSGSMASW